VFAGIIIAGFVIIRHQENISRLLKGQESRFSMKKPPSSAA
jgi:glycerol-3-phosphate acyltransferase PlsY